MNSQGTDCTGDWAGCMAGLDVTEKINSLPSTEDSDYYIVKPIAW
jgi:hypothetical protein